MKTRKTILMTILAMIFVLSSQLVKAQFPTDSITGKVRYIGILELPSLSKDQIYDKAKFWIASTLKSSDNMTELDNQKHEKLIGTGTLKVDSLKLPYIGHYYSNGYLNFKFIILIKENRVKYCMENIILYYNPYTSSNKNLVETNLENTDTPRDWSKKMKAKFLKCLDERVNLTVSNLISSFIYSFKNDENTNW